MPPRKVQFTFENRRLEGVEGEPIAKALFAAGIRTLSYSVKYRRPRGIHCARGRCVMCHMEIDGALGVPTCITPLAGGMRIRRQDHRPFFALLLTWIIRALPFPAGFYYRFFTKPAFVREMFLSSLRRMAGVGRLIGDAGVAPPMESGHEPSPAKGPPGGKPAGERPRDAYDIVVVGSGLSGMSAALTGASRGAGVLLVDEYTAPGGHSIGHQDDDQLRKERDRLIAEVTGSPLIDRRLRTTAQGFYPPHTILLGMGGMRPGPNTESGSAAALFSGAHHAGASMTHVRASTFIFATGAYDIIPVFENNDTPGIFGQRALRLLLERDRFRPGERAVVYGTGAPLEDLTRHLRHHGIDIGAVVDARAGASQTAAGFGEDGDVPYMSQTRVLRVDGGDWVRSVKVSSKRPGSRIQSIACDLLCVAFVGQAAYELPFQAGFRFVLTGGPPDENRVMKPARTSWHSDDGVLHSLVGEVAGETGWRDKIASGQNAGKQASLSLKTR
jgi:sarcosine oxidase subunit alpha